MLNMWTGLPCCFTYRGGHDAKTEKKIINSHLSSTFGKTTNTIMKTTYAMTPSNLTYFIDPLSVNVVTVNLKIVSNKHVSF